ncbi:MAG: ParB/RepB/Spo0J family partition protein [Alphaproteobacteria bacterium]|nr:MAG: ParB/RepB/Spo0J family partition protein [Alphaproteobacteria bacterium]TAF15722.1 MAG: ParB/RepB/Spo0J family partition protein [Alphaproteobacteria bacterium]TAF40827.1 MAG: ParB/RepB/Spo0J family partition protein [Alphaproteobacteria bacterium]TAF77015.1 MAG: ParB/RepB/Spo0J family partition protein [Alphaproteobacteria bacterium]
MIAPTKGLGKGLSALMAEEYGQEAGVVVDRLGALPIDQITSGAYQPRTYFDQEALKELADSIRSNGVMQPILVRQLPEARNGALYEIVAGERRWRASKIAGLTEVPVIIKEIDDQKALEMALIENIQRQDLNAIEEADGYQQLMDGFGYTQEELSVVVGKSRSYIANMLRLLALPALVKGMLKSGEITAGHARALLKASDPEKLVQEIIRRGLNVRQTENIVKAGGLPSKDNDEWDGQTSGETIVVNQSDGSSAKHNKHDSTPPSVKTKTQHATLVQYAPKDPDIVALEEALTEHLGMRVVIDDQGECGSVTLHYRSLTQLDNILRQFGGSL